MIAVWRDNGAKFVLETLDNLIFWDYRSNEPELITVVIAVFWSLTVLD